MQMPVAQLRRPPLTTNMAATSPNGGAEAVPYAAVDLATHAFVVPQAQLRSADQLAVWLQSEAASAVLDCIATLSASVHGVKASDPFPQSEVRVWPTQVHTRADRADCRRRVCASLAGACLGAHARAAARVGGCHPAAAGPPAALRQQGLSNVARPPRAGAVRGCPCVAVAAARSRAGHACGRRCPPSCCRRCHRRTRARRQSWLRT
jgi:hypothetical protein